MAAATRTSFRPRPLDNNKQLEIVRDENADLQSAGPIDQADIEATRRITNGHETLDAHNEKVRPHSARQPRRMLAMCSRLYRLLRRVRPLWTHPRHLKCRFPVVRATTAPSLALLACWTLRHN